eukprot:CAMPEP_0184338060 /NCGR_PEP_ID=MMETSP1089-20130417/6573_1 /TAXON_ID=38269 ORGANISM="Gloeochaete wittrockiana, Strain SAG46.84" /NCGR_SAMPLE_ID=MMETSP1089 /ASSEMBLY_ACC=CAM_ASM_000445 /LENGTH=304 /DNA_ID=CAMNT_0026664309 /DNA_START=305 /DNA_END=1219 /DNA_ORIENTATION=+
MNNSFVYFIRFEEDRGGKFDIIHSHDWLATPALLQMKVLGRKSILTMHSTERGRLGGSEAIRTIERSGCMAANRIITASKSMAQELETEYGIPPEKVVVIFSGINVHRYDGYIDIAPVKTGLGFAPMDPMVLFCGRLVLAKGADILVDAIPVVLKGWPNARFTLVGDGELRPELEKHVWERGLGGCTRILGHVEGIELINLFKSCDVVCVPSREEPFGIVILESWAAGKPVVATRNGASASLITDGVDGYLCDSPAESIAEAVLKLFSNFQLARTMGAAGRNKAATTNSWEQIAKKTETCYKAA